MFNLSFFAAREYSSQLLIIASLMSLLWSSDDKKTNE